MNHKRGERRPAWPTTLPLAVLGVALVSGTTVTAYAHHGTAVPAPVRGLVIAVGTNTLQLQTSNATLNVGLSRGTTHVVRSVMGSTADVTAGKRVDLHLLKGTRTVDVVRIEEYKPVVNHHGGPHGPSKSGDRSLPHGEGNGVTPQSVSGQVVSMNGSVLTVRYVNGSTSTFTLASNVRVNEALSGSLADLQVGETVQIFLGNTGSVARTVIIINA